MCKDFEQYGNLNAHNLITSSHFALLTAKTSISGKIAFYNKDIHVHEELENYIETHMHHALENNEFKMFLQPKIDLKTGKIAGAEALVRWIRENGTFIFPDQLIPFFEENGFRIIMKQIFHIPKQLHINTIVEGVETDEHEDFIREPGSDYSQGYFYSPPITIFEFEKQYPLKPL